MTAKKRVSRRLGSDLKKVDAHQIKPHEYRDAPELTEEMLAHAVVKRAGRPVASNPRRLVRSDCRQVQSPAGRRAALAGKHVWRRS